MKFDLNTIPAATASPLGERGRLERAIRRESLSNNWYKVEAQTSDEMFQGCFFVCLFFWQGAGNSSYPGNSLIFLSHILGSVQSHHFMPITRRWHDTSVGQAQREWKKFLEMYKQDSHTLTITRFGRKVSQVFLEQLDL